MSPELQQQAASFLEATKQAGSNAAQFLQEQAPQYVNEYVAYLFWSSAFTAMFWLAILAAAVTCFRVGLNGLKKTVSEYGGEEPWIALMVSSFVIGLLAVVFLPLYTLNAVKAKVAPKVVIVEHVSKLIGRR